MLFGGLNYIGFVLLAAAGLGGGSGLSEPENSGSQPDNERSYVDYPLGGEEAVIYQNATNIDKGYAFSYSPSKNAGKLLGFETEIPAEVHIPDKSDPSLKFYVPEGPVRLYIPTLDVGALQQPTWRYKECNYSLEKIFSLMQTFIEFDADLPNTRVWRFLVEARCADAPGKAVQYLFGNRVGLMAFTLGELTESDTGDVSFSPLETYFWHSNGSYGFGARVSAKD